MEKRFVEIKEKKIELHTEVYQYINLDKKLMRYSLDKVFYN